MIFSRKISFPSGDLLTYLPFMCSDRLEPRWEVLDWSVYGQQNHCLRGGLKQSGWLKQGELPRTTPIWLIFVGDVSKWKNSPLSPLMFFFVFLSPLIIFFAFFLVVEKNMDLGMVWGDLVMLMTEWKGLVFRESTYFKRQTSLWLEHDLQWDDVIPGSSQVCKACVCSLSPQITKPKGKHSTFLEFIRVIGPRRKKGSLNLTCCFLFFCQSLGPSSGVIGGSIRCFPVEIVGCDSGNGMMLQAKFRSSSNEAWLHFPSKMAVKMAWTRNPARLKRNKKKRSSICLYWKHTEDRQLAHLVNLWYSFFFWKTTSR